MQPLIPGSESHQDCKHEIYFIVTSPISNCKNSMGLRGDTNNSKSKYSRGRAGRCMTLTVNKNILGN